MQVEMNFETSLLFYHLRIYNFSKKMIAFSNFVDINIKQLETTHKITHYNFYITVL